MEEFDFSKNFLHLIALKNRIFFRAVRTQWEGGCSWWLGPSNNLYFSTALSFYLILLLEIIHKRNTIIHVSMNGSDFLKRIWCVIPICTSSSHLIYVYLSKMNGTLHTLAFLFNFFQKKHLISMYVTKAFW